jgi:hypothetical protein
VLPPQSAIAPAQETVSVSDAGKRQLASDGANQLDPHTALLKAILERLDPRYAQFRACGILTTAAGRDFSFVLHVGALRSLSPEDAAGMRHGSPYRKALHLLLDDEPAEFAGASLSFRLTPGMLECAPMHAHLALWEWRPDGREDLVALTSLDIGLYSGTQQGAVADGHGEQPGSWDVSA